MVTGIFSKSINFWFPASTSRPSTLARTPWPAISSTSQTLFCSGTPPQALTMDLEMGWVENCSARAAVSNSSSGAQSLGWTPVTAKVPLVRVPVLSSTTIPVLARASR